MALSCHESEAHLELLSASCSPEAAAAGVSTYVDRVTITGARSAAHRTLLDSLDAHGVACRWCEALRAILCMPRAPLARIDVHSDMAAILPIVCSVVAPTTQIRRWVVPWRAVVSPLQARGRLQLVTCRKSLNYELAGMHIK